MSRTLSTLMFVIGLAALGLAVRWVAQGSGPAEAPPGRPPYILPASLEAIERGRLQPRATLTGSVLATQNAPLGVRLAGRVASLEAREGETVAHGAVLARLEDDDQRVTLARAQATLELARRELTLAEAGERQEEQLRLAAELDQRRAEAELAASNVNRNKELLGTSVIAQSSYDALVATSKAAEARVAAAEQTLVRAQRGARPEELAIFRAQVALRQSELDIAQNDLEKCTLRAPFDASVVAKLASLGETVAAGRAVFDLVDLASREIELELPSGLGARLREGAGVLVTIDERPEFSLHKRVSAVIATADAVSRNFRAVVRLEPGDDPEVVLKPGMFVRAQVELEPFDDVLLVNEDALRVVESGTIVVRAAAQPGVDGAPGGLAAEWVPVRVLGTQDGRAAIESLGAALQPGDRLVITGVDLAFPGAPLLPTDAPATEAAQ